MTLYVMCRKPDLPISSSNIDLASTFFLDFSFGFMVKSAKISMLSSNKLGSNVLSFSLVFREGLIASVANISSLLRQKKKKTQQNYY